MAKKKKIKYFVVEQTIRDGEREYTMNWTKQAVSAEVLEEEYNVEHDCGVDVEDMEIYTEDVNVQEVTEAEYKILSRFI